MKWWQKTAQSNASIKIDISEYSKSLVNRIDQMIAFNQKEKEKSSKFKPDVVMVSSLLNSINYPAEKINLLISAIQNKNEDETRDWIDEFNTYHFDIQLDRKVKTNDPELKQNVRKTYIYLRDILDKLDYDSGLFVSDEEYKQKVEEYEQKTYENMNQIRTKIEIAIKELKWNNSPIVIIADELDRENEIDAEDSAHIQVGSNEYAPSFMIFFDNGKTIIDDIYEAGEEDFFPTNELQSDYFSLIKELQNPGSSKNKINKTLKLYTARPIKDREFYQTTTSLPSNIFLSNQEQHVLGLANDLGGSETRDVWFVELYNDDGVIRTLDPSNTTDKPYVLQYYQTVKSIPVKSINLVQEGIDNRTKPDVIQFNKPEMEENNASAY